MLETLQLIRDVGAWVMAYLLAISLTGHVCGTTCIVEGEDEPEIVLGAGQLHHFGELS